MGELGYLSVKRSDSNTFASFRIQDRLSGTEGLPRDYETMSTLHSMPSASLIVKLCASMNNIVLLLILMTTQRGVRSANSADGPPAQLY